MDDLLPVLSYDEEDGENMVEVSGLVVRAILRRTQRARQQHLQTPRLQSPSQASARRARP